MKTLNAVALILLIVGGINWGLMGLFNFDLVAALFGGDVGTRSVFSRVVYVLVGIAAIYGIAMISRLNRPEIDRTPPRRA